MSAWPSESYELCEQITRNAHDRFKLSDSDILHDPLTDEEASVESLLSQVTAQLTDRDARPFTFQRLKEMAELGPEVRKQYAENHGAAYIRALLQLVNVSTPSTVFDDFDKYLEQKMPEEIRLEPIVWASIEVPQFSGWSGANTADDDHELASPPKKPKLLKDEQQRPAARDEKVTTEDNTPELRSKSEDNEPEDDEPEDSRQEPEEDETQDSKPDET